MTNHSTLPTKTLASSAAKESGLRWDDVRRLDSSSWERIGSQRALKLFKSAAEGIPAYKDFLKKHRINPKNITAADFSTIPETTKENYIKAYPLEARSWGGTLHSHRILAVSSGTSGEPTLWPRGREQEREAIAIHEFIYGQLFAIDKYQTLLVIGFPMGLYVSGVATALPSFAISHIHSNLTIATVGNQKEQVLTLLEHVGDSYEQIVLVGHPFFLKDVLESGKQRGIKWRSWRMRMLSCSEGFTEVWREYVSSILGKHSTDIFFNTYGSSEFLLMGFENPFTIAIRKAAESSEALSKRLFGSAEPPGLFQFNPLSRFIESNGTNLLVTANSGIPLIRFNQHDVGRVYGFDTIQRQLRGVASISKHLRDNLWKPWRLPFVTLFGRSDRTLIFYAANIYPEHISLALGSKPYLSRLTGKFSMRKSYTSSMDQQMHIVIELRRGVPKNRKLAAKLTTSIVTMLEKINMEYLFLRNNLDKDIVPRVELRTYQDPEYFPPGHKPKFIVP
ncbi:MAG TPA: hypothetical protein VMU27_00215 [Candidatus Paceibacterota bacterium]|nr:hypothetical protein [Candidatus Paceibacterota bacterium]